VRALRAHASVLEQQPAALHEMLLGLDFFTDAAPEVVLAWPEGAAPPADMVDVLRNTFLPNRALAGSAAGAAAEELGRVAAVARGKVPVGGQATAYVCEHGTCRVPVTDAAGLAALLAPVKPL
ncbi:MAG: hypothetical protein H6Q88_1141, partial [Anaeromyxobacteraceae bacterium]|nr:hypothetical protein [Anaeromyxobacteraceae bacterium]